MGALFFVLVSTLTAVWAGGGLPFLARPVGAVYAAVWAAWWLVTALWRRRGVADSSLRRHQLLMVILSLAAVPILILGPPWEYAHFSGPVPRDGPLAWLGLVLFGAGVYVQAAAMIALKGHFTVYLGVQEGQRLVRSGPYRLVRHPGYAGYLTALIGIALAMSSLIAAGVTAAAAVFILWRIGIEESLLVAHYGEEYLRYRHHTKRLVPFVF